MTLKTEHKAAPVVAGAFNPLDYSKHLQSRFERLSADLNIIGFELTRDALWIERYLSEYEAEASERAVTTKNPEIFAPYLCILIEEHLKPFNDELERLNKEQMVIEDAAITGFDFVGADSIFTGTNHHLNCCLHQFTILVEYSQSVLSKHSLKKIRMSMAFWRSEEYLKPGGYKDHRYLTQDEITALLPDTNEDGQSC